jgi:hypothetical protein
LIITLATQSPVLRSDLEAAAVEIKDLKHKLDHYSRYSVLSPPCEACVSLKGKLLHATKENTELQQEVAYLTVRLEKTVLSEKMIEEDLSRVEKSATKSTYRLGVGFERCEKKGEKSALKFVPSSSYHRTCRPEATVLRYSTTSCGRPLTGAGGRGYDLTRWCYTAVCMPRGRIDKMGCTERRLGGG